METYTEINVRNNSKDMWQHEVEWVDEETL